MKVLFLAPRLPWPADTGGKIRTLNILKEVARRHSVELLSFSFESIDHDAVPEFEKLGVKVHLVNHHDDGFFTKALSVLTDSSPYSVAKYNVPAMHQLVEERIKQGDFDVIHCDHIHMAHYVRDCGKLTSFVDEHNVEYKILERCAAVKDNSVIKRMAFANQARKMADFEQKWIPKFHACGAVSDDDAQLINQLIPGYAGQIHVVPNGVDTKYFKSDTLPEDQLEDALVFTGSMDWLPNDDAAMFLCRDILPLIWEKRPRTKVYIVGKSPSKTLIDLAKKEDRIKVTGRVDDVRVYVNRSKVFVVPLRIGGGTRLKILEAMSMEKAVVSTTIGAEGIAHTKDQDIVLADTPSEFAQKTIALLDNAERRKNLGQHGRRLVLQTYDWPVIGQKVDEIYQEILHVRG